VNTKLYKANLELLKALPAACVPSTLPIVPELREAVREASSVLDVGCGTGSKIAELRALTAASILGIDINAAAIAVAKSKHGTDGTRFLSADVLKPLEMEADFDVINMSAFLTCVVPKASRELIVKNCATHLSHKGLLVVSDFLQSWHLPLYRQRYERGESETGERGSFLVTDPASQASLYYAHHFSEPELQELLDAAGLALLTFRKTRFESAHHNVLDGFVLTAKVRP
jgi:2-polyprenyl-3-methyl-5-hydroxy-6-metoxy-1,4-benzoquinol methylase